MSWAGLKKGVLRATNQVLVKDADKVHDRAFEVEERRYRIMEKAVKKMQTESKGYLDSLRAVSASQVAMGEIVASFYEDAKTSAAEQSTGDYYNQCVKDLDAQVSTQIDEPFRQTVFDPINKFCNYFTDVNEALKKREHKKIDYEQNKAKVRRLIDKPAKDVTKLPRAEKELQAAKDIYDALNDQLKTELPELILLRVPYFDASFEAMVKIQLMFCTEGYTRLAQVQNYLDPASREEYANGVLDQRVDQLLGEMWKLQLCALGGK